MTRHSPVFPLQSHRDPFSHRLSPPMILNSVLPKVELNTSHGTRLHSIRLNIADLQANYSYSHKIQNKHDGEVAY